MSNRAPLICVNAGRSVFTNFLFMDQIQTHSAAPPTPLPAVPPAIRSLGRLRRARRLSLLLVLLLAAGAGAAWWNMRRAPSVHFSTVPITRGAIARSVTATGTVNPILTIIVGSYVSGVIQQLFCDYNTQVKQGQICAKIDPRPYQSVVDQDSANLD